MLKILRLQSQVGLKVHEWMTALICAHKLKKTRHLRAPNSGALGTSKGRRACRADIVKILMMSQTHTLLCSFRRTVWFSVNENGAVISFVPLTLSFRVLARWLRPLGHRGEQLVGSMSFQGSAGRSPSWHWMVSAVWFTNM
jgi:hypothetical protein